LSGWRNFNQAILLRAVVVSLVTWLLLFTTGGVGSFFLLWYFVLVSVYPFLLPPVPATLLLLGIPLSYVLLLPLSSQSIPLFVVISRVFLLAFIGGLLRVLGATMHRYVAEQQQIQEDLRYQSILVRNISEAVITTDLNFIIQSWNSTAEALYGWRAEEVLGKSMGEVVPTRYSTAQLETVQHKDGRDINVIASVTMVRDEAGQPISVLAINHDITGRKQAEEALRESETRFRATFEQAAVGIAHVSLDGRWLRGNQKLCEMSGTPVKSCWREPFKT
jgi:PAS domain-containing protein